MATGELPTSRRSAGSNLGDVSSLLGTLSNIFLGSNTTQTQQTHLTPEAMNRLIQQMMEGTSGLAAVSGGQRNAGLYNSSTNQLMVNDLLTRVAGEAGVRGAKTTNTSTIAPQLSPAIGAAGLGLWQLLASMGGEGGDTKKRALAAAATGAGTGDIGAGTAGTINTGIGPLDSVLNAVASPFQSMSSGLSDLFGASSASAGVNSIDSNYFKSGAEKALIDSPGMADIDYSNLASGRSLFSGMNLKGSAIGIPGIDPMDYSFAPMGTYQSILGKPDTSFMDFGAGVDMGSGGALFDSIPWTAGIGSLAQGDLGGAIGSVGKAYTGNVLGTALTPIFGPLAPIIGALGMGLSVICTELHRQNLVSTGLYLAESRYAASHISAATYTGYRMWADTVVGWMRKSQAVTKIVAAFAIPYIKDCAYIAGSTCSPKPNYFGFMVGLIGVPICWTIGTVAFWKQGMNHG